MCEKSKLLSFFPSSISLGIRFGNKLKLNFRQVLWEEGSTPSLYCLWTWPVWPRTDQCMQWELTLQVRGSLSCEAKGSWALGRGAPGDESVPKTTHWSGQRERISSFKFFICLVNFIISDVIQIVHKFGFTFIGCTDSSVRNSGSWRYFCHSESFHDCRFTKWTYWASGEDCVG